MSSSNFITKSSATQFKSEKEFVQHVHSAVSEVKEHHIFIFTDVSELWGRSALKAIDEVFAFRHTLDPYEHTLRLKVMPVLAHEAIQPWLNKTLANWHFGTGDLNQAEYALLFGVANAKFRFTSGPYVNWEKTPDFAIMVNEQRLPTVVAEAGWSESHPELLNDVNRIMVGGNGATNIAILFKWYRRSNNRRAADIQVYRKDRNNTPILIQEETVFPRPRPITNQTIRITRGDLFGAARLHGRAASDVLSLDLELLRDEGTRMLHIMGLVPA